jgi:hypothetical protein
MNQLPDYLPSSPAMYGVKQQADQHLQGSSLSFSAAPTVAGEPADPEEYTLKLSIKSSLNNERAIWQGYLNYGMFIKDKQIEVRIPNTVTAHLPGGIYYIAIEGKRRTDPNDIVELFRKTLSIEPSAASHYPIAVSEITTI